MAPNPSSSDYLRALRYLGVGWLVSLVLLFLPGDITAPSEMGAGAVYAILLMPLICFGPALLSVGLIGLWGRGAGRGTHVLAALGYVAWFFYVYFTEYRGSADAQAALVLVFAAPLALPVMMVFWGVAWWQRSRWRKREAQK